MTTRGQKDRDFNDIMTGLWYGMRRGWGVIHRYGKIRKRREKMQEFFDKANLLWGAVIAVLTWIFGEYWFVFLLFLALNVIDCIYGYAKSRATQTLSSEKGARGVLKKVSYWVIIAIAFSVSGFLISLGAQLGVDLGFLQLLGWFVLAVYIINELTSIVENMVALGIDVPEIFVKGLNAVRTVVNDAGDRVIPKDSGEEK